MDKEASSSLHGGTSEQEIGSLPGASLERVIAVGALLALIKQGESADGPDKTWGHLIQALSEANTCNELVEIRENLARVLSLCDQLKDLAISEGFDCLMEAIGDEEMISSLDKSFKAIFYIINSKLGGSSTVDEMIENLENLDVVMDSIGLQLVINSESDLPLKFGSQTDSTSVEISMKDGYYLNTRDRFAEALNTFLPCIYLESQEPEQAEEEEKSEHSDEHKGHEEEDISEGDDETNEDNLEVKKLVLTKIIQDTAENFTINKLFIDENTISSLLSVFPKKLSIIGFYGNDLDTQCAVTELFEVERIPKPKKEESLIMYYKPDQSICAIVVANEEPSMFPKGVVQSGDPITVAVRLLTDLCPTIVPCLSDEMYNEWYFSSDPNASNPFYKKKHFNREINIKKEILTDKGIYPVKVESYFSRTRDPIYLSKDTYGTFFSISSEENRYSEYHKERIEENMKMYAWKLAEIRDIYSFNTIMHQFSTSLKTYNIVITGRMKGIIQDIIQECIHSSNRAKEEVVYNFFELIESKFVIAPSRYYGYYVWDSEKQKSIKSLSNKILDEKSFLYEGKKLDKFIEGIIYKEDIENEGNIEEGKEGGKRYGKKKQSKTKTINDVLSNISKKSYKNFIEKRQNIREISQERIISLSKEIINTSECIRINISKSNKEIYGDQTLKIVLGTQKTHLSSFKLDLGNLELKQVITFDEKLAYAIVANYDNETSHVLKFSQSSNLLGDAEELPSIDDPDIVIAWGSSKNKFVLFKNNQKVMISGPCGTGKYIHRGIAYEVYSSEIQKVISAYYMPKKRKVFFLNQKGHLYYIDMISDDKSVYLVKDSKKFRELEETSESSFGDEESARQLALEPVKGTQFLNIQVSTDECIYALQSDRSIECYDENFEIVHIIELDRGFIDFNLMSNETTVVVFIQNEREMKAFKFQIPKETIKLDKKSNFVAVTVRGNPVFDILHLSIAKFGTYTFHDSPKVWVYHKDRMNKKEIEKYFRGLKKVTNIFKFGGFISDFTQLKKQKPFKVDRFVKILASRVPLHIASIQNGNLIPLQNGINNFEEFISNLKDENFLDSCVEYIKFAHIEALLKDLEDIKIIAIIGKQSSGKSYLMNRLFGSRFDVAAHRCTDGIWASLSFINDTNFLVLDCEGLFSAERTSQDEVKLCLFLTSLSDVIILNSDLSSNRNLHQLFEEFALGVDRLKGKKLFKGKLDIALRDIPDNEAEMAEFECDRFLGSLLDNDQFKTLEKLFGGRILNSMYHNFENEAIFEEEIVNYREYYCEAVESRWKDGEDLLMCIKTVLTQIFSDDECSLDYRTFQLKSEKARKTFDRALKDPEFARQNISNSKMQREVTINDQTKLVELSLFDISITTEPSLDSFNKIFLTVFDQDTQKKYHNQWYEQLSHFINDYFTRWKGAFTIYFENLLPKAKNIQDFKDSELLRSSQKLDNIIKNYQICLRKCFKCDNTCTKFFSHDLHCDCNTNHKCAFNCEVCEDIEQPCKLPSGHISRHVCETARHTCSGKCSILRCEGDCVLDFEHEGECMCSRVTHECGEPCAVSEQCHSYCRIDIRDPHELHNCNATFCPYDCIFNHDNKKCSNRNHLHALTDTTEEGKDEPEDEHGRCIHICDAPHNCSTGCEERGLCDTKLINTTKLHANEYNEFVYNYVEQIPIKSECVKVIEAGKLKHSSKHKCSKNSEEHTCTERCPDCGVFCSEPAGHEGNHSSKVHRNKDRCIFISTDTKFSRKMLSETGETTYKFSAGESAAPELCEQSCTRKGRGHVHPVVCKGGSMCLGVSDRSHAIHSKEHFYSSVEEEKKGETFYDLVECSTYWRLHNWVPPVETKNPDAQKVFAKCNFACKHSSHSEPIYCEGDLFHSDSNKYSDHNFPCTHEGAADYDIVFIIDSTGSMGGYFPQLKATIKGILESWKTIASTRFAVVAYTDHTPDNAHYNGDNPVGIYPPSTQLQTSNTEECIKFIDNMRADGGGGMLGEAMIDGMKAANSLRFREGSKRIYILTADDTPHGDEFINRTAHPRGCPCGTNWKNLIQTMKYNNVDFIFCQLNERLNKTFELFNREFGGSIKKTIMSQAMEFVSKVSMEVSKIIEKNLEFAVHR